MTTPPSWPASSAAPRIGVSESRLRKPRLDVAREIGAGVHRREQRALDERHRERERDERLRREAGQMGLRAQAAGVHGEQQHREDEREDRRRRVAPRSHDRAAREERNLVDRRAHSAPWPSSERPVFARKTSSRLGLVQLEVRDVNAFGVERADDVGEARLRRVVEPDGDAA